MCNVSLSEIVVKSIVTFHFHQDLATGPCKTRQRPTPACHRGPPMKNLGRSWVSSVMHSNSSITQLRKFKNVSNVECEAPSRVSSTPAKGCTWLFSLEAGSPKTYLSHDSNGGLSFGLGHAVLYQVVHVLIIEETDEVKGAKTGRTPQGQIPNHHGAGEEGAQCCCDQPGNLRQFIYFSCLPYLYPAESR